jgi:hypothetical protein
MGIQRLLVCMQYVIDWVCSFIGLFIVLYRRGGVDLKGVVDFAVIDWVCSFIGLFIGLYHLVEFVC